MSAPDVVAMLLDALDEAFDRKAWHGPNLRGSLRGLSARQAAWRAARGRHNVWEIAVHAAYWKYAVRRVIKGEKRGSFSVPGSNWFARPVTESEAAWRADVAFLVEEHRLLREAVSRLRPADLGRVTKGSNTLGRLIRGAAAHDVYHAGQIQLLKRLQSR